MSSKSTEMAASRGVSDVSSKSAFGDLLAENKKVCIGFVIVILLGVLAWGMYSTKRKSTDDLLAIKLYQFRTSTYKNWEAGTVKTPEMMTAFETMKTEVAGFSGLFPFSLELSDKLLEKDLYSEAKMVITDLKSNNDLQQILLAFRKSVVFEELGELNLAITALESVLGLKYKLMEARVYLDLGRFYLSSGNKDRAKKNFDYVIKTFARTEESKVAKLYLSNL